MPLPDEDGPFLTRADRILAILDQVYEESEAEGSLLPEPLWGSEEREIAATNAYDALERGRLAELTGDLPRAGAHYDSFLHYLRTVWRLGDEARGVEYSEGEE